MNAATLLTRLRHWISLSKDDATVSDWEGVYRRFGDVPKCGPGFDDEAWASDTQRATEETRNHYLSGKLGPIPGDHHLLPLLVASIQQRAGGIKVLDFGGGLGISFLYLCASIGNPREMEYHVVEKQRLCDVGALLFKSDSRIHFHTSVPSPLKNLDVAYLNSSLQYVEDYPGLLSSLCKLGSRFILFARCSAGDMPTFATAQINHSGSRIPYWFINLRELTSLMGNHGYQLTFAARSSTKLRQAKLPETHRQGWARNLLFVRAASPLSPQP